MPDIMKEVVDFKTDQELVEDLDCVGSVESWVVEGRRMDNKARSEVEVVKRRRIRRPVEWKSRSQRKPSTNRIH